MILHGRELRGSVPAVRDLDLVTRIVDFGDAEGVSSVSRTPSRVFALANTGVRLVACAFDFMIVTAPMCVLVLLWMGGRPDPFAAPAFGESLVIWSALFALHMVVSSLCEWLCSGQTPGKNILGVRVVSVDGSALSAGQAFVRNLIRVVDFLPLFYIGGAISIGRTLLRQRLGDRLAGCVVVSAVPFRELLASVNLPPGAYSTSAVGSMIESLLARRDVLAPGPAVVMARKLALWLDAERPVADDFNLKRLLREERYMDYLQERVRCERGDGSAK